MPRDPLEIKVREGETLFQEGERSKSVYLIQSGKFEVFKSTPQGPRKITTLQENQMIGIVSFFDKEPRSASVKAIEDSVVLEFDTKDFDEHMQSQPIWLKVMIQTLVGHLRNMNEKIVRV